METTATTRTASERLHAGMAALHDIALPPAGDLARRAALQVAEIVRTLDADDDVVIAAMIQPLLDGGYLDREGAVKRFGAEPVRLAGALSQLGQFGLPADWTPDRGLESAQAESLRKMLLAVIGDVRLVVVRLAEQLQKMRSAKSVGAVRQRKLAIETREVYAPLANRLGVWQVKWELEDLAFRYLEPLQYKHIAAVLKTRRSERERYIEELKALLQKEMRGAGVEAVIDGRPKHIFSIWRKMQAKQLAFEQLMDIRAARVLVNSIAECYAALGVVHSLWQFIPGEFDDYIATPKGNLYRSIHTAVIGPSGEPVEIQIRTHEMHADSERGVAAHWRYKEGGRGNQAYERKINELRSLLAPAAGADAGLDFLDRVRADLFQDRIYVISPKGEIVDVPVGGTPLDFAYQIHTDLGHRTRGAKVNGRMVALNYQLKNSETVEIITAKTAQPSRDWLSAQSGFLASPRHRNKVRAWYRRQEESQNKAEGSVISERESHEREPPERDLPGRQPHPGHSAPSTQAVRAPDAEVQGIGDLLSSYARCCKPVPPEAIAGYITVGRGVSIHSQACANLARLKARAPERVLAVGWGTLGRSEFPVDIEVHAYDRRGLVRDVSAALADEKISIRGMTTVTEQRDHIARMRISMSISGLPQLSKVLSRIARLPGIISARRKK
jgi:GTP pyrophosphokinase